MSADKIEIHTDGACSGNPGPGGWGAIICEGKNIRELSGGEKETTNNRMEMMAAIEALKSLPPKTQATLFTDSTYLKDGLTKWLEGWKKNGWKTAAKKPVKNQDLWEQLDKIVQDRDISWKWVKGHSGDRYNERADELARHAIPGYTATKTSAISDEIQDLFSRYAEALSSFNSAAVASFWSFPALSASGNSAKVFATREEFEDALDKLLIYYASIRTNHLRAKVVYQKVLTERTKSVQVDYQIYNDAGKVIADWRHGYVLRLEDEGWRAITAFADEEVQVLSKLRELTTR